MNGIWSTRWLFFQVMSKKNPKWDSYQPLEALAVFFSLKPVAGSFWDPPKPRNQMSGLASSPRRAAWHGSSHHFRMICNVQNPSGKDEGIWGIQIQLEMLKGLHLWRNDGQSKTRKKHVFIQGRLSKRTPGFAQGFASKSRALRDAWCSFLWLVPFNQF